MPKILQINVSLNGSTGQICQSINQSLLSLNDESRNDEVRWSGFIIHGARYGQNTRKQEGKGGKLSFFRNKMEFSESQIMQIGNIADEYIHYAESLLLDRQGLGSRRNTKRLVEAIKQIQPDIIHLHNIHGYYINYKILFQYLNNTQIPIVWTLHDCWPFTGHCTHFVTANCNKWTQPTGCHHCTALKNYPKALIDRSHKNFMLKKQLFTANHQLYIVPVSQWIEQQVKKSFLKDKYIHIIKNGIDLEIFKPHVSESNGESLITDTTEPKQGLISVKNILGVASTWDQNKGLNDFYELRRILPQENYKITLIGLNQKQIEKLPKGIKGICRTESPQDLAKAYSEANVLVNPTYADTFPTVNIEAIACGTPVVTYQTGGAPEIIDSDTGIVVPQGDLKRLAEAVKTICQKEKQYYTEACRARAEQYFDKKQQFKNYIKLYELITKRVDK